MVSFCNGKRVATAFSVTKRYADRQEEFGGRMRNTQMAVFELSFHAGGCIERAVNSAGGPSPDGGPY